MAEIGPIGTVVGIASAGIKLSITLYSFSETVSTAHVEIKNIARDVSLTSAVLEELGASLKQDDQARLYSGSALRTANEVVKECEGVFNDINSIMGKAMDSASKRGTKKGKLALSAIEKLKWPFLQPKMEMLRGNLERLKSTLVLMLNVLSYARDLRTEKKELPKEDDSYQRMLLESLLRANQEATRNYEVLLKTIGPEADGRDKQAQSRSLESEASTLRDANASSSETPFISLTKLSTLDRISISSGVTKDLSAQESEIESTIKACITEIENALVRFEQTHIAVQGQSMTTVQIEVQKNNISADREAQNLSNPWKFISIAPKQELALPWAPHRSSPGTSAFDAPPVSLRVPDGSSISTDIAGNPSKDPRTAAQEVQVEVIASIIREKKKKAMELRERLDSQNLAVSAESFRRGANRRRALRPWYAAAWDSLPSTGDIVSPIRESIPSPATTVTYLWDTLRSLVPYSGETNDSAIAASSAAPLPISTDASYVDLSKITIQEAACATSAAPRYFKQLTVQSPNFSDGSDLNCTPFDQETAPKIGIQASWGSAAPKQNPVAIRGPSRADMFGDCGAHQGSPSDLESELTAKREQLGLQVAQAMARFQQARQTASEGVVDFDSEDDEDDEDEEIDSVHQLLTEWTTLFDE